MRTRTFLVMVAATLVVGVATSRTGTAQDPAPETTVLLASGQRTTGSLASFDHSTVSIRDKSGQRRPVQWNDVVLLDFTGAASGLPAGEAEMAGQGEQTVVLRDGRRLRGRIVDFVNEAGPEATVVFDATGQGQQQIKLDQVARIYVRPFSSEAMTAAGFPMSTTSGDVRQTGAGVFATVPGNTRWMSTEFVVYQGERIGLRTEGTIYLRAGSQDEAKAAGATHARMAPGAPLPNQLAGALIGRIGERGAPFGIGDQSSIVAPATGVLYLGINDDQVSDNDGAFTVRITRVGS